ncbi:hypothetical protein TVD_06055 [Thioalkalivibrio versutus]|uniref:Uncharacterized protein n=1 Tax=Thioalkalivibrio versutus TaxID=106634 RepID=A0A0G3G145_9GAMM|nr:DUF5320 domain-containing protein [Thioalkalivibrio versutus]AKJ94948.1 hypothetical protein TVD_06055 [Thioalkalivibrio versutus]
MNRLIQQKGNAAVLVLGVLVLIAVGLLAFKVLSHPWFKLVVSPGAASAIVEEVETLRERNEELRDKIEDLEEELAERIEDDDRETDAGRRLFFRN